MTIHRCYDINTRNFTNNTKFLSEDLYERGSCLLRRQNKNYRTLWRQDNKISCQYIVV